MERDVDENELSESEIEEENATELPDREEMSLINFPGAQGPMAPIDPPQTEPMMPMEPVSQ